MLAFLGSSVASVQGSSVGFHEFLEHHHTQAIVLPRLYEPVPAHVPELSNQALLKLWETNQFSPILRNPEIEVQLAEAVIQRRDLNPAQFDAAHPTLGKLLSDPSFFQYAIHLYNLDTARFVHYHHALVPVIRGVAMMMQNSGSSPGSPSGTGPQVLVPPPTIPISPAPGGTSSGPGPPSPLVVPAPSSIVLMGLGLAFILYRVSGCRLPISP